MTLRIGQKPFEHQRLGALVCLTVTVALFAGCQAPPPPATDNDDKLWSPEPLTGDAAAMPEGRDVMSRMLEFLTAHEQLGFEALVTYEAVQESGQMLHFDMVQRMAAHQPGRFWWTTLHDDATVDSAWFDRGEFTLLRQPANVWGQIDLPPNISDGVESLVFEYDLDVPFADMLIGDPMDVWLGEDVSVQYVGEAWVDGFWTDHVALRKPGADLEVWIRQGEEPFPVRRHINFTDENGAPSYSARYRKWVTSLPDDAVTAFSPPPDAERIELVPVNE